MEDSRRAAHAVAAEEAEPEAAEREISFAAPAIAVAADPDAVAAAAGAVPTSASLADLEAERALHRRRAERFGGEYVDPVRWIVNGCPVRGAPISPKPKLLPLFHEWGSRSRRGFFPNQRKKLTLSKQLQLQQAKKPGPLRDAERRARLERKDGFVTGIDLFADEERVSWCCFFYPTRSRSK